MNRYADGLRASHVFPARLDVFIEIHAEQDAQNREQVYFEKKADGDLDEDQIDGKGWVYAGGQRFGKNGLNRFGWRKNGENFTQHSAQQPSDKNKHQ